MTPDSVRVSDIPWTSVWDQPVREARAAVKVMLHGYTEDREVVGRFLQEAFVASGWSTRGLVARGDVRTAGRFGIEAAAAVIAIQLAAGLAAVHELGVVHRDINPRTS